MPHDFPVPAHNVPGTLFTDAGCPCPDCVADRASGDNYHVRAHLSGSLRNLIDMARDNLATAQRIPAMPIGHKAETGEPVLVLPVPDETVRFLFDALTDLLRLPRDPSRYPGVVGDVR